MPKLIAFLKEYMKAKYFNKFNNRRDIELYQDRKIKKFFKYILPKSKFYFDYYKEYDLSDWRNLPIIDKKIMIDNFNELNTVNIDKDEAFNIAKISEETRDFSPKINGITIGLSSGTSGNRGIFLVSDEERMIWAGNILAKVLPHSIFNSKKQKIAFFLRANSNLYTTLDSKKIEFNFYDLINDIQINIYNLNKANPTILVSPPSMLRILAKAKEVNELHISPIKIVSVAEVLDPIDKLYIEKIFKQKLHQIYQCTEGFLACTCEHGTLHLNEDVLSIQKEYLDKENGKFIPIITNFTRKSQPIIRYRLNDVLTEKKEICPCGSHFTSLEFIEGRCDDLFYLKDITTNVPKIIFPDFIRRAIITSSDNVEEYRVIQEDIDNITVEILIKDMKLSIIVETTIIKTLTDILNSLNCKLPKISFTYNYNPNKNGVKLKRIERRFKI